MMTRLMTLLFLSLVTVLSQAEITVRDSAQGSDASGALQLQHNLKPGSNRIILVGVSLEGAGAIGQVSDIRYGDVEMSLVPNSLIAKQTGSYSIMTAWYQLLDAALPADGEQTLNLKYQASDITAVLVQIDGVDQSENYQVNTDSSSSTSSLTSDILTTSANNIVVDIIGGGHPQSKASFSTSVGSLLEWNQDTVSSQSAGLIRLVSTAGRYPNMADNGNE